MDEKELNKRAVIYAAIKNLLMFFIAVAVGTALVLIVYQEQQISQIVSAGKANGDRLIDCTTPHHACYESANSKTGEAIASINQVAIYASYCAHTPGNDTVEEIQHCVEAELESHK